MPATTRGEAQSGYAPHEELRRRLADLEARVRRAVAARRVDDPDPDDRFRGLYISEDHVDTLLGRGLPRPMPPNDGHASPPAAPATDEADRSRLGRLRRDMDLDELDLDLLTVALAPDLDPRFERLFAYLQDDVTRRRPSIGLTLELAGISTWSAAGRDRLADGAPLVRAGLLRIEDAGRPLLTRHLRVPDRVVAHLLGSDRVDGDIAGLVAPVAPAHIPAARELAQALARGVELVYHRDRVGSAAVSVAVAALETVGRVALTLDLERLGAEADPTALMRVAAREARLTQRGIVAGPIDGIAAASPGALSTLADAPVPVILAGQVPWEVRWSERVPWITDAPAATTEDRRSMWADAIDDADEVDLLGAMEGFRLGPEQIARARRSAAVRALARGESPSVPDLHAGARAENAAGLDRLARRVEPRARWSDLVLPEPIAARLRELTGRARHREAVLDGWGLGGGATHGRGVTALFAGDPGTGKTMSAEVVAAELGLDLYVIDLSSVVDKYIGETEKNLDRIFSQADRVNGVLLFDEADALFGQRSEVSDARDRYANVEIAYLLQRMEQFDGLAVLTTNLRSNVDEAFLRRLDALIDFPMPEAEHRLAIWRLHLPPEVPLADDVDLEFMAQRFELSGGHIRNVCLTAAYLAVERDEPVSMGHLVRATQREYTKLGRLTVEAEFGPFLRLVSAG